MFFLSTNITSLLLAARVQIWIQPEHPKQLSGIFSNLTRLGLWFIFPECDLKWTLFILDAAPALKFFAVSLLFYLLVVSSTSHGILLVLVV
jgi:hypothetical protein